MVFTVQLSAASDRTVEVKYSTADDTATAGEDYTALTNETLRFEPGEPLRKTIAVEILNDVLDEADAETFTLKLHNPTNASLGTDPLTATGTINDNDAATAELSVNNVSATEGGTVTFEVILATAKDTEVMVSYETVTTSTHTATGGIDCSAASVEAGVDFIHASGTVTFAAQQQTTTDTIDVTTCTDLLHEPTETFGLRLTSSQVIAPTELATGSINDANDRPELSVNDPDAVEDAGHVDLHRDIGRTERQDRHRELRDPGRHGRGGTNKDYTPDGGTLSSLQGTRRDRQRAGPGRFRSDEEDETFTLNC